MPTAFNPPPVPDEPPGRWLPRREGPATLLEEHAWPANAVLVLLATLVAAAITARADWSWPPDGAVPAGWLANAWVRLGSLATTTAVMLAVASRVRRRSGRRLQFATLVSLAAHLVFLGGLSMVPLELAVDSPRPSPAKAEAERPRAADFQLSVSRSELREPVHEQPLEAELPGKVEPQQRRRASAPAVARRSTPSIEVEAPVKIVLERAAAAAMQAAAAPAKRSTQASRPQAAVPESVARAVAEPPPEVRSDAKPRPVDPSPQAARRGRRGRPSLATTRRPAAVPEAAPALEAPAKVAVRREATQAQRDPTPAPSLAQRPPSPRPVADVAAAAAGAVAPLADAGPPPAAADSPRPTAAASSEPRPRTASRREPVGVARGARSAAGIDAAAATLAVPISREAALAAAGSPAAKDPQGSSRSGSLGRRGPEELPGSSSVAASMPVAEPTGEPDATGPPGLPPSSASSSSSSRGRRASQRVASRQPGAAGEAAAAAERVLPRQPWGAVAGIPESAARAAGSQSRPARRGLDGDLAIAAMVAQIAPDGEPGDGGDDGRDDSPQPGDADDTSPSRAPRPAAIARRSRGRGGVSVSRASEGLGGLAELAGPQPGMVKSRRVPTRSPLENDARFIARVAAASLPVDGSVREASRAFTRRDPTRRGEIDGGPSDPRTEEAIERGLEFLVRAQQPDGRWSLGRFPAATSADIGSIQSDSAATGLALLAFLGAGYDHYEHKHRDTVRRGLEFLLAVQHESGDLYLSSDARSDLSARLYTHAIATMALCEAAGMTGDPRVREAASRACRFIETSQHPERGGWRYTPGEGSDLSVSGWMLLALRSGQLAGIEIASETFGRLAAFLDRCEAENGDAYVYNPYAADTIEQRAGRLPTAVMTAAGLLCRLHTGWKRDDPRVVAGVESLTAIPPSIGSTRRPRRDVYLWYYAVQVLEHVGGEDARAWRDSLHGLLVRTQSSAGATAGSWNPGGSVPDRWGPHGGRIYVTTLNLLSLEVAYRRLPLFEVLGE